MYNDYVLTGILNNFPEGFEPHDAQIKLLKSIEQAFADGHKFVVCNAPTGSGKSFIAKTVGNGSSEPSEE